MKKSPEFPFPIAFYFSVEFKKDNYLIELPFQEVSGLTVEVETEELKEGGENSLSYKVPVRIKHGNLVLKRSLGPIKGDYLEGLTGRVLNGDPIASMPYFEITVSLLDEKNEPMRAWSIARAYPVKWDVVPFASNKNELAIETLEFAYTKLRRTV